MRNLNEEEQQIYDNVLKRMSKKTGENIFDCMQKFNPGDYVKHNKGGLYIILNIATIERTKELTYVYMDIDTHKIWIRPVDEMEDGRFTKIEKNLIG